MFEKAFWSRASFLSGLPAGCRIIVCGIAP
jgi:hypothetical protein